MKIMIPFAGDLPLKLNGEKLFLIVFFYLLRWTFLSV